MIEINEERRHAVEQGELVRASANGQDALLLRTDIFRRTQGVLQVEKAVIQAGHTREPVEAPALLKSVSYGDEVVMLPTDREEEIRELVADDRERSAWHRAVGRVRGSWAEENADCEPN